jgi:hypothetical protein
MSKTKLNIENVAEITKLVNESFTKDVKDGIKGKAMIEFEESYILELLVSANNSPATGMDEGDGRGYVESFQHVSDLGKDIQKNYEENEVMKKVVKSIKDLTIKEKKLIKLMGVNI